MSQPVSHAVGVALGTLQDLLRRSVFAPGSRLPGERSLAETIGVSRATLRQALGVLSDRGVLSRHPQRGWYVEGGGPDGGPVSDRANHLQSFTELAESRGFTPSSDIRVLKERSAQIEEAERLGLPPASRVVEMLRVRLIDANPICIDHTVMSAALCGPIVDVDLTHRSLYDALEEECGVRVFKSSSVLQAKAATAQQAELLRMDEGGPVLECVETTTRHDGVPILTSTLVYRGDAYRFHADLYRQYGG